MSEINSKYFISEKKKMLAGKMYNPEDPGLIELRKLARQKTEAFNATFHKDPVEGVSIIKSLFGSTGQHIHIEPSFRCDYGENIHVGENFYANFDCVILDVAEVRFGDNCLLAPQVGIYTATHPLLPVERNSGLELASPITIGDNCWIGGHAIINPGVRLGDNIVVASGSVVTKNFGDDVVIGGNPARVLKEISTG